MVGTQCPIDGMHQRWHSSGITNTMMTENWWFTMSFANLEEKHCFVGRMKQSTHQDFKEWNLGRLLKEIKPHSKLFTFSENSK